ncbi:MAG TPA: DUF6348 family protein [Candidatus Saccharimonadia bacterium]|nr:DUF6348 family protein [Candidatus Saccharimonadia bacterium]
MGARNNQQGEVWSEVALFSKSGENPFILPMIRRFAKELKFGWDYFVRHRHRMNSICAPSDFDYPEVDDMLMTFLEEMFQAHDATAFRVGNWVAVDGGRLFARAAHFNHRQNGENHHLRADFIAVLPSGEHIIEAFAGIGSDRLSALKDACGSFSDSTFHVWIRALLDNPCDHADEETWVISGTPRKVTMGLLKMRGHLPLENWSSIFSGIQKIIEQQSLRAGLHWLRLFYAQVPGDGPVAEVLLNNIEHQEMQSEVAQLPWPMTEGYYSARLFLTIQDALPDRPQL